MTRPSTPPSRLGPAQGLVVAMWFGVVTGVVEVIHQAVRQHWFGVVLPGPDEVIWLVPACHLLVFSVAGGVLALLGRVVPALRSVAVVAFLGSLALVWSQLMLHPAVAGIAAFVLAVGISAQLARTASKRAPGFLRLTRRMTPLVVALVALVAAGMPIVRNLSEASALAGLPAARQGAPNVLLIVLDTVRADNLEVYGHHNATAPTLSELARTGVVFDRAVSTSSWTVPAHATMFTGRYTHEMNGARWLGWLDNRFPTLAEILGAHGYATGGFVGNVNYCCNERGMARGFSHYEDHHVNPVTAALSFSFGDQLILGAVPEGHIARYKRNDAATVTSGFLDWLDQREDRPFFAFLNYFDAHALYQPPPGYEELFGPRSEHPESWRSRLQDWAPEEMAGYERAYDCLIRYIDDHIARILAHLREQGQLDNTIVVVTADHGEHFGEHGLVSHANSLYRQLLHVPLIVSFPPQIAAGQRIVQPVSLRDLARTILDLCEIEPRREVPGHSLAQLWNGTPAEDVVLSPALAQVAPAGDPRSKPDWWPVSRGTLRSLTDGCMHYIRAADGTEELFDWCADPGEERDLMPTRSAAAAAIRKKIQAIVQGVKRGG